LDDGEFIAVHSLLEQLGQREGWMNRQVREALLDGVPPDKIKGLPERLAQVLVTAHEVAPEWHVRI
jgi:ribonucleoside-diphosphate reductase alpha chain